jgi:hypothetical protein
MIKPKSLYLAGHVACTGGAKVFKMCNIKTWRNRDFLKEVVHGKIILKQILGVCNWGRRPHWTGTVCSLVTGICKVCCVCLGSIEVENFWPAEQHSFWRLGRVYWTYLIPGWSRNVRNSNTRLRSERLFLQAKKLPSELRVLFRFHSYTSWDFAYAQIAAID